MACIQLIIVPPISNLHIFNKHSLQTLSQACWSWKNTAFVLFCPWNPSTTMCVDVKGGLPIQQLCLKPVLSSPRFKLSNQKYNLLFAILSTRLPKHEVRETGLWQLSLLSGGFPFFSNYDDCYQSCCRQLSLIPCSIDKPLVPAF